MSLLRSYSIARTSWQLQLRDPASSVIMTVLPLILIAVLIPSAKAQLVLSGYPNATGAEQTVPGLAVLYAFLSVEQVTTLFFREHAWGTWDRLRASPASAPSRRPRNSTSSPKELSGCDPGTVRACARIGNDGVSRASVSVEE